MSAIRAASAFVELSLRQSAFTKGLKSAERSLAQTGSKIRGIGQAILGVGSAGVSAFSFAVLAASDLNEAVSKTEAVFGTASRVVTDFASTSANAFGLSKVAANGYSSELGLLLLKTGATQAEAANLSVEMVKLAADIASFNNISNDEALDKLKAGLVGSSEPLRTVGVLLSANAVNAKAAELGLEQVNGQYTEGAKVAARYALILEQTKETQGDFGRTSDGLANAQRRILATFSDIVSSIGTAVLPIYEQFAGRVADLSTVVLAFVEDNQELIRNVFLGVVAFAGVGAALIGIGSLFGVVSFAIGGLISAMGAVASIISVATSVIGVIGSVLAAVVSPIGLVVAGIGILIGAFLTMTSAGQSVVDWFSSNFVKIFDAVSGTMKGIFDALRNGNLQLAAEIGFTGVKLAVATVLDSIESLFGISFKNMFTTLAAFGKSVAGFFAALNVLRVQAVNSLAEQISKSDALVRFISGVDPEQERERTERLNRQAEALGLKSQDTSIEQALKQQAEQNNKQAADLLNNVENFDPSKFGQGLRDSFDTEGLKAKLEQLKNQAAADIKRPITDDAAEAIKQIDAINFNGLGSVISEGQQGARKIQSAGTFVGAAAGRISGGTITDRMFALQKQQHDFDKKREENQKVRDNMQLEATKNNKPSGNKVRV